MRTAPSVTDAGQRPEHPGGAQPDGNPEPIRPAGDADRSHRSADQPGDRSGPATDTAPDRPAMIQQERRTMRSWPLLALAAPAAVAVWSGWVGIGQMTGFGEIRPLPAIWNSLHVDTVVTLPIGVEAYAAFALCVWLTSNAVVSDRTRRFAGWSAIAALILGMAGQVAYHLLIQAGMTRAPWEVTTLVSCLPVLVLGLGSALAHMLRSDAAAASAGGQPDQPFPGMGTGMQRMVRQDPADRIRRTEQWLGTAAAWSPPTSGADGTWSHGDRRTASSDPAPHPAPETSGRPPARIRHADAYAAAAAPRAGGGGGRYRRPEWARMLSFSKNPLVSKPGDAAHELRRSRR